MKTWQKPLLFFSIVLYILFGALVFHFIETANEKSNKIQGEALMTNFINDIVGAAGNNTCVTVGDLESFIYNVISLYDQGVIVGANTTDTTNWDFASCMQFCMTIITTIGYGNISPTTRGSRTFFAFYALFGIPLALFGLSQIGASVHDGTKKIASKLCCFKQNKKHQEMVTILIINGVLLVLLVFVQGIVYTVVEGWTYDISLYYILVTLSTVGFGDYVAASSVTGVGRFLYQLYCLIWIFMGLTWFSNLIAMVQDLVSKPTEENKVEPSNPEVNGEIEGKPKPADSKVEDLDTASASPI